jgi:hypothetical protein
MKQLRLLGILLSAVLIMTSCEKDDPKPTKKEMLTGKNWYLTSWTVNPAVEDDDGNMITNVFALLPSCTTDDFSRFDKNGSITFDEGVSKCSVSDDQTIQGTWSFNSDESIVTVVALGETNAYRILELNNSSVKVEYDEFEDGKKYTSTKTYKVK